ncbi:hypothetical protein [uncultured Bradyrhizobium sp.]|uniref:hypothetical protein n=1 Tax=uncultured Bradyrhizobium sp. TaxID=199684 RepID=UPI0035CB8B67
MDLDDMLKEHQRWLEKAHQSLTSTKAKDHAPADLKQPRIDAIKARVAELAGQKDREIQSYDNAIAELNNELAALAPPRGAAPAAAGDSPKTAAKAKGNK